MRHAFLEGRPRPFRNRVDAVVRQFRISGLDARSRYSCSSTRATGTPFVTIITAAIAVVAPDGIVVGDEDFARATTCVTGFPLVSVVTTAIAIRTPD
jgi:hypothetical protein